MTRLTTTDLGTILGVWAHPDDEAYLTGGLMALARQAGQHVVVATATRGEAGTSDPDVWPPRRLARVREAELSASLSALGVTEHHFLGYVDGTLPHQDLDEAIGRVAEIMTAVRPDTIVTFGPDGLTGHADHRRVSTWTTVARELVAPDARLLYATTTTSFVERWQHLHDRFDIYMDPDLPMRTSPDQIALEVVLDGALADRKLVALRAQASQTADLIAAMGEQVYRAWTSTETFRAALSMIPGPVAADVAVSAPAMLSR
ncbi:MAG TPA: PIG-L family deacetylase [Euzebyales bacterium]|nr:PIG-L family deacetylase [Euzebyales bacterium]